MNDKVGRTLEHIREYCVKIEDAGSCIPKRGRGCPLGIHGRGDPSTREFLRSDA